MHCSRIARWRRRAHRTRRSCPGRSSARRTRRCNRIVRYRTWRRSARSSKPRRSDRRCCTHRSCSGPMTCSCRSRRTRPHPRGTFRRREGPARRPVQHRRRVIRRRRATGRPRRRRGYPRRGPHRHPHRPGRSRRSWAPRRGRRRRAPSGRSLRAAGGPRDSPRRRQESRERRSSFRLVNQGADTTL
jgi:hypothetical protein